MTLDTILLILAFGCFCLGAFGVSSRVNFVAAGLAIYVLTVLVEI